MANIPAFLKNTAWYCDEANFEAPQYAAGAAAADAAANPLSRPVRANAYESKRDRFADCDAAAHQVTACVESFPEVELKRVLQPELKPGAASYLLPRAAAQPAAVAEGRVQLLAPSDDFSAHLERIAGNFSAVIEQKLNEKEDRVCEDPRGIGAPKRCEDARTKRTRGKRRGVAKRLAQFGVSEANPVFTHMFKKSK